MTRIASFLELINFYQEEVATAICYMVVLKKVRDNFTNRLIIIHYS